MKSSKQCLNHKQKRIGFKRPVSFKVEDIIQNNEDDSIDQQNVSDAENEKRKQKNEEDHVDISKLQIPSLFESDQKLNISKNLFNDFDWIQTEPEFFDFDQDIQIPDKFMMPF